MRDNGTEHFKILVVEDEPVIQKITAHLLKKHGHVPDCASNGTQAVALTAVTHYPLIFMDVGLPDIDGMQATQRIRQQEHENDRPPAYIVAVTAYPLEEVKAQCLIAGINKVFMKPLTLGGVSYVLAHAQDTRPVLNVNGPRVVP